MGAEMSRTISSKFIETMRCFAPGKGQNSIPGSRLIAAVLFSLLIFLPGFAAAALTVTPITWDVIGLDSNDVNTGPNKFPVGVRVCTDANPATSVSATFVWDSSNSYIDLRSGTLGNINLGDLAANGCADAYFEIEVDRDANAYDTTRSYHIDVSADGGATTASSPRPRQIYVEYLISQNRNSVTDIQLDGNSVPPGGTMTLMVGNTYTIDVIGQTATQGYNALQEFITLPNTIFQVLSVNTTYTAGASPIDQLYGNACGWDPDPNSPNYRSCLGDGKNGGTVTTTYEVKILQVPNAPLVNPEPLSTLIYDFSGSSYHYNADYDVAARYMQIVNASIEKSFSPKTITPGGTSTLTFTINNPGPAEITDVNFTDTLPAGLTVVTDSVVYTGCGSPNPPAPGGSPDPLSFSNITVAGLSDCIIEVSVSSPADGTYVNTTSTLMIGDTDTGDTASDTLIVSSQPAPPSSCLGSEVVLASWTMEPAAGTTAPPPPTTQAGDVSTASASYATLNGTNFIDTTQGNVAANSWAGTAPDGVADTGWNELVTSSDNYFQFTLDTANYGGITIDFNIALRGNGDWASPNSNIFIKSSADGSPFTAYEPTPGTYPEASKSNTAWTSLTGIPALASGSTTTFRISSDGGSKAAATIVLDDVVIRGCPRPLPPTLAKSFTTTPIVQGGTTPLTFSITNPNASALTGVSFSDVLPGGLLIATPNGLGTTCGFGTAPITATAGTSTISLSGAAIAASEACTITVGVTGTAAGSYTNTTTNISSTETGPNLDTTPNVGFGQAGLTVIAPPVINMAYGTNPIFTGESSTLGFTISNPNPAGVPNLTDVTFTTTLPAGLDVTATSFSACGGTVTINDNDPSADTITLTGGTLASGATCTFNGTVTGTIANSYSNDATVSSTNGGTGNTATASVLVRDRTPGISVLKQVGLLPGGPWTTYVTVPTPLPTDVYFRFIVENTGDVDLTNVSIVDLSLPGLDVSGCDRATLTVGDFFYECIVGPESVTTDGAYENIANATSTETTSIDSSTALYATSGLSLFKNARESSFITTGDVLNYDYLVINNGAAPLAAPVTITDDKTTVTCPAVNTVGNLDNFFDPNESMSCTATYTITAADDTAGFVTNIATATAGGTNSNSSTVTVPKDAPTYATLADVRASHADGRTVIQWTTTSQIDSQSFLLERWDGTAFVPVAAPLPALPIAGGADYHLEDPLAGPGSQQRYRIIETELGGATHRHGPYDLTVSAGASAPSRPSATARAVPEEQIRRLADSRIGDAPLPSGGGDLLKIAVTETGLYQLRVDALADASGRSASELRQFLASGQLALRQGGETVAYTPSDDGEALLFYGTALDSLYSDKNIYWLSVGEPGPSMTTESAPPTGTGADHGGFDTWLNFEQEQLSNTRFAAADGDFWYWDYLLAGLAEHAEKSFTLEVPAPMTDPARLQLRLQGAADQAGDEPDHQIQVSLNGTMLATVRWDGAIPFAPTVSVPAGLLRDGANELHLQALPDSASSLLVDGFRLHYTRALVAGADALALPVGANEAPGTIFRGDFDDGNPASDIHIDGFSSDQVLALSLADPRQPRRLDGVVVEAGEQGFQARFRVDGGAPYLSVTPRAWKTPAWIRADQPSDWRDPANQADYLVIAPAVLADAARQLADYRAASGFTTAVALLGDIHDEFNHGLASPGALQDFLAHAHDHWALPPSFVVLVGNGSVDYRDHLGFGDNLMPPLLVPTPFGLFAADNALVDFDGDARPDIPIGRIPALSGAEMSDYLAKLMAYEQGTGNWTSRVIMAADDGEGPGMDFPADSDRMAALLPATLSASTVYLANDPGTTRTRLLDEFRQGALWLNYIGHGGGDRLAREGLLRNSDVAGLDNGARLPVISALTCLINYYEYPGFAALGELLTLNPGGGAVAVWAPTGLSFNSQAVALNETLFRIVFQEGSDSLGEAIRDTLAETPLTRPFMGLTYTLLGDPAVIPHIP